MSMFRILLTVYFFVFSMSGALAEEEREGGILGTGIVGTITALGSIYVNGQHIEFDSNFAVTEGVSTQTAADLRPGHTVAVVAQQEDTHWRASFIRQIVPLVGPAENLPDGGLSVMGTIILSDPAISDGIQDGDWVAVSGLWQSGEVIATRIDRVSSDIPARIEGTAIDIEPGQPLKIGGTVVTGVIPSHVQEGDVVRAVGTASTKSLQFDRLETGVFAGTPQVILSEGYFSVPTSSGLYTLLGSNIVSYTDNPDMIDPSTRHLVCANNGKIFPTPAEQVESENIASLLVECFSDVVE